MTSMPSHWPLQVWAGRRRPELTTNLECGYIHISRGEVCSIGVTWLSGLPSHIGCSDCWPLLVAGLLTNCARLGPDPRDQTPCTAWLPILNVHNLFLTYLSLWWNACYSPICPLTVIWLRGGAGLGGGTDCERASKASDYIMVWSQYPDREPCSSRLPTLIETWIRSCILGEMLT